MLSVVIKRNAEPSVVQLTAENLQKELSSLLGAEILLEDSWSAGVERARNDFVSVVEADCLVNSGYFSSLMGLFKKNPSYRQLAMLSSGVGLNNWGNKIYGYSLELAWSDPIKIESSKVQTSAWVAKPMRTSKSRSPYPVQVGFVPGAVIRRRALLDILSHASGDPLAIPHPTSLSMDVSRLFWESSRHIHVNPSTTYVTTEEVDQEAPSDPVGDDLSEAFRKGTA